ncbi:hypothetical protein GCM10010521_08840 [Streptomyces rameus]|uniref:Uncharacterized protein n=1 Tax=Streptomyces rameus TaxID=68261 RepID=A0ABP6MTP8_9ACTN
MRRQGVRADVRDERADVWGERADVRPSEGDGAPGAYEHRRGARTDAGGTCGRTPMGRVGGHRRDGLTPGARAGLRADGEGAWGETATARGGMVRPGRACARRRGVGDVLRGAGASYG